MVFLARDGHLAFAGSPAEARRYFGVEDLDEVYSKLAGEHTPAIWAERFADSRPKPEGRPELAPAPIRITRSDAKHPSMIRQWWLLTRRNADVSVSEPADTGGPARVTGTGHGDDGNAVQARRIRSGRRG